MNLLLPLGLLGLIGIPVILLVHIIKPKYHERTISSTYIWHLAKKYRKRKIPFEKLTQFLLIAIQFLIVAALSFLLTKPFVSSPAKIVNDQIILLDCSASMNAKTSNGETRYKKAVDQIVNSFDKYSEENKFTIIFIDENPADGNVIASTNRAELEREMRENGKCTFTANTNSNYAAAIEQASLVLKQNKNADVTIYTDHRIKITGDINLVDVSNSEWNVALLSPSIAIDEDIGYYGFKTTIASYNRDADVYLELSVKNPYSNNQDVIKNQNGNTYTVTRKLHLRKNVKQEISFDNLEIYHYDQASFTIKENASDYEAIVDDFVEDNSYYAFNGNESKFRVQLISPQRQIFTSAISAIGGCEDVIYAKDVQSSSPSGYDLYIFDGVSTTSLPDDGAIWVANPSQNTDLFNKTIRTGAMAYQRSNAIVKESFLNNEYGQVVKNIKTNSFFVNRYTIIESYDENVFEPVILTEDGHPLVLVGKVGLINACVLAFPLEYSNLGVTYNMPLLAHNMFKFSVNRIVSEHFYQVGETISLHAKSNTAKVELVHNGNKDVFAVDALRAGVKYKLETAGVYTVITTDNSGNETTLSFIARIADSESNFAIKYNISLGEKIGEEGVSQKVSRNNKDISIYFAIALLALLVIEWGVQYREQY